MAERNGWVKRALTEILVGISVASIASGATWFVAWGRMGERIDALQDHVVEDTRQWKALADLERATDVHRFDKEAHLDEDESRALQQVPVQLEDIQRRITALESTIRQLQNAVWAGRRDSRKEDGP